MMNYQKKLIIYNKNPVKTQDLLIAMEFFFDGGSRESPVRLTLPPILQRAHFTKNSKDKKI
jgi:hypothetical protein